MCLFTAAERIEGKVGGQMCLQAGRSILMEIFDPCSAVRRRERGSKGNRGGKMRRRRRRLACSLKEKKEICR